MDKATLYARDLSGTSWRKSSFSNDIEFECVEVAELGDGAVALRDSTDHTREPLRFTAREWAAFTSTASPADLAAAERGLEACG